MSSKWPQPGIGMVSEYQRSGVPYMTSSNGSQELTTSDVLQFQLPRVSQWVEISCWNPAGTTGGIKVGVTQNGVNSLGAVTASVGTGFQKADGTWEVTLTQPTPTSDDQFVGHTNYFVVPANTSVRLDFAATDIFLLATKHATDFSICAGMTNIKRDQLDLTGSQGYWGVG